MHRKSSLSVIPDSNLLQKISWKEYQKLEPKKKARIAKFKEDEKGEIILMISPPIEPNYSAMDSFNQELEKLEYSNQCRDFRAIGSEMSFKLELLGLKDETKGEYYNESIIRSHFHFLKDFTLHHSYRHQSSQTNSLLLKCKTTFHSKTATRRLKVN